MLLTHMHDSSRAPEALGGKWELSLCSFCDTVIPGNCERRRSTP